MIHSKQKSNDSLIRKDTNSKRLLIGSITYLFMQIHGSPTKQEEDEV